MEALYMIEGRKNGKSALTTVLRMNSIGVPVTLEDYWRIMESKDPYEEINKLFKPKET